MITINPIKASGLYHYKTWGEVTTVEPEICSRVYVDMEYRKKWDSYCKSEHEFFHI